MSQSQESIAEASQSLSAEDWERLGRYGITPESSEEDMVNVIQHQISELQKAKQGQP